MFRKRILPVSMPKIATAVSPQLFEQTEKRNLKFNQHRQNNRSPHDIIMATTTRSTNNMHVATHLYLRQATSYLKLQSSMSIYIHMYERIYQCCTQSKKFIYSEC